jgi:hypothetical protein
MSRRLLLVSVLLGAVVHPHPLLAQAERAIVVGQSVTGALGPADPVLRTRRAPYHLWALQADAGQRVQVDLTSSDFDAFLILRDANGLVLGSDDDGGDGRNARLHAVLPRAGTYQIVATAVGASASGAYTLSVSGWEPPVAPRAGRDAAIRAGETVEGVLEPGDELSGDGPYQDRWRFEADSGARLRVEMRSSDLDSYLTVLDPAGRAIGSDDDALGGRDAAVSLRAATRGRYTVLASSYGDAPAAGAYRLSLISEEGMFADPGVTVPLAAGVSAEGRLEEGDARGTHGLEDRWTFAGRKGQGVRIDASSDAFDAFLVLLRDGIAVDSDDDGGEGRNARVITVLPTTGTYTAVVSAYGGDSPGGRYTIRLLSATGPAPAPGRVGRLAVGDRVIGRLEPGDAARDDGALQDVWELDVSDPVELVAELRSTAFDTYLELYAPDGSQVAQDDDGLGEGTNSMITARLTTPGRYRLIVRAYSEKDAGGAYELALASAGPAGPPGQVGTIGVDQTVFGRLEPGDSTMGDGTLADVWVFRASQAGQAVIDLRSSEFDAYLVLQDSSGHTLATDDDGGDGTNARIEFDVVAGRTYRIIANSYGGSLDTGAYRLSVRMSGGRGSEP